MKKIACLLVIFCGILLYSCNNASSPVEIKPDSAKVEPMKPDSSAVKTDSAAIAPDSVEGGKPTAPKDPVNGRHRIIVPNRDSVK